MRRGAAVLSLLAATLSLLTAASASTGRSGAKSRPGRLLPDLYMALPDGLRVMTLPVAGRTHYLIGFISAAENVGSGPLVVEGARASTRVTTMRADQVIMERGGGREVVRGVGTLKYNVSPTHQHWHLQQFMTYRLNRYVDDRLMRPSEKTGFCLGDRYRAPWDAGRKLAALPGKPARPTFTGFCGLEDPQALSVREGISVGYGDVYSPWRDGQQIDVTGLAPGLYVLAYFVNVPHRLVESDYANNSSSVAFALQWPHGRTRPPTIDVRRRCPLSPHCPILGG